MDLRSQVAAMLAGDELAWRRFLADYGRLIYAVGRRLGLTEAEREDHFQTVCLAAHRSLATLREPDRLAAWVYNIAYRAAIDTRRRQRPTLDITELEDDSRLLVEPEALEALERLEAVARVRDALGALDPRCRDLLHALFIEEPQPSYLAIQERQGIPIGSIGPTRARCLERLKKTLAGLSNRGQAPSTGGKADSGKRPRRNSGRTEE